MIEKCLIERSNKLNLTNVNYSLTFSEQILLRLGDNAQQFVESNARFGPNWRLRSDLNLGFSVADYRIDSYKTSNEIIYVSRFTFLGLHSPLPWSFIDYDIDETTYWKQDWINILNKRFWGLDFLVNTCLSNMRFLALSNQNLGVIRASINLIKSTKETNRYSRADSVKPEIIEKLKINRYQSELVLNRIKIDISNRAILSRGAALGVGKALGVFTRMKIGYRLILDVNNPSIFFENKKNLDVGDFLRCQSTNLDLPKLFVGLNQLVMRFNSKDGYNILASNSCLLGRSAFLGKETLLQHKLIE